MMTDDAQTDPRRGRREIKPGDDDPARSAYIDDLLAKRRGEREWPTPAECPVCGKPGPRGEQMPLEVGRGQV